MKSLKYGCGKTRKKALFLRRYRDDELLDLANLIATVFFIDRTKYKSSKIIDRLKKVAVKIVKIIVKTVINIFKKDDAF